MIKAFIFDIGGTLVKTDDSVLNAIELALKENGLELANKEKVISVLGTSMYMCVKTAVETSYSGQDIDKKIEHCYKSMKNIFPKKVISHFKIFQGVLKGLQQLKNSGIKLALFTGFDKDELNFFLHELKLSEFFDVAVTIDDVKKPRPCPEGLLLEIEELGVKKEECIYVGDTVADIQMAKNAKVNIVCVKTGAQNNELLEKEKPNYFVEDISEMIKLLSNKLLK
jgi:HAD superfamily hydrolase (TIGR01549 family)